MMSAPVIMSAPFDSRNRIAAASSSVQAKRPTGISCFILSPFSPCHAAAPIGVGTTVGDTVLAVMPRGAHSLASTLVMPIRPALAEVSAQCLSKLFLAAGGVSIEAGISYPDFIDLHVKRAMIDAAKTVYLLADSRKFGRRDFATFGAMDRVHVLITDRGLAPEYAEWVRGLGIGIIYA